MARFDVYANPDSAEHGHTPYFLDVQNDYIAHLSTRVVIPLRREAAFGPRPRNLNPLLHFADNAVVLDTAALGAVPVSELRRVIGDLRGERALIQEALDTLFGAY
ncbi:Plasmid maintenance protein CcdB [Rubrivivax sp. A210]|uniref:CcdB family protein n=1 Tax=Rubrivivax sp. A210 TaxID=2772301 RepID=UPI001918BED3|nr:CcdB family protein [Rubrivivax sp. A210]CAD5371925.1 Plasmid maintenance protein CcdB [Rubrivivax sp. A210]